MLRGFFVPLGDHGQDSSAVVIFFIIKNEDLTLGNEPELCGFGHFCVYSIIKDQTGSSLLS